MFTPECLGENDPIGRAYFSNGLVQPPCTRWVQSLQFLEVLLCNKLLLDLIGRTAIISSCAKVRGWQKALQFLGSSLIYIDVTDGSFACWGLAVTDDFSQQCWENVGNDATIAKQSGHHLVLLFSRWWFQMYLYFCQIPGEMIQFDVRIFFRWVAQPPTSLFFQQALIFFSSQLEEQNPWFLKHQPVMIQPAEAATNVQNLQPFV